MFSVTSDQSWLFHSGFPELMVDHGWRVHLVSDPGQNLESYRQQTGIHVHGIPMKRNPAPFRDLVALVRWIDLLRKTRPTVVSLGTPKAALLGLIASKLTQVPHRVYVLHGIRFEATQGLSRSVLKLLEKVSMVLATNVVSVSNSLRDLAIEMNLVNESKIEVLGAGSANGIDLGEFKPGKTSSRQAHELKMKLGIHDSKPVLGFVGRLTPEKGLSVLASARRLLAEWEVHYHLVIIGAQDDATKGDALFQIDEHGSKAIRVGWVANVAPYYQLFDYLVLPTFREGLSGVVLEAMASGVPVIGSDVTGVADLVDNSSNGVLVVPNDSFALAQAIRSCLGAGEDLWDKDQIRMTVQPYRRETVQLNYLDFYKGLLDPKQSFLH